DATKDLINGFGIQEKGSFELQPIRKLRNKTIGHPTSYKSDTSHTHISRIYLQQYTFTYRSTSKTQKDEVYNVDLIEVFITQLTQIEIRLREFIKELNGRYKVALEKFRNQDLASILRKDSVFNNLLTGKESSEVLEKVSCIKKMYLDFVNGLKERNVLESYSSDLDTYNHAIEMLKSYWDANSNKTEAKITSEDAYIYAFYLVEKHKYFFGIAQEIDAEISAELNS
ncbi:MAG: hypothetical protein K2P98_02805, partial [Neisseriaceae bacterium]|nr:hypothetical protein [Neisseriaceae bacterium]